MKTDYTDDELRAMQATVVDPGVTDSHGFTHGRHEQNPFKGKDDVLASRWSKIHYADDGEGSEIDDGFSAIGDALAIKRSGFHKTEGGTAGSAFFPVQAKNVEAWEQSCQEMHAAQVATMPDAKPLEPGIRDKRRGIVRGD